jgi:hypothetical protein
MIDDTIRKIENGLANNESLDANKRIELQGLLAQLKTEIAQLSTTHSEEAESIAGFAERSASEAIRSTQDPKLLDLSIKGMSASVEKLEQSHPKLVGIVNSLSKALSDLGI